MPTKKCIRPSYAAVVLPLVKNMEPRTLQLNKNSEIRRVRRTRILFVAMLLVLIVIAGAIGFLRRPEFQVADVDVTGARVTDPAKIESFARAFMRGSYAFVIPKTNALLLSKSKLNRALLAEFPNLKTAAAEFPVRNHLEVRVVEKDPRYLWCAASCWFADQFGVMYDAAPNYSDGVFVVFRGTADGNPLPDDPRRSRFAPQSEFDRMQTLLESLAGHISVAEVDYLGTGTISDAQPTGPGDVALRISQLSGTATNPQAVILTTQSATGAALAQSLELLQNQGKFAELLKSKPDKLLYIDLRFEGKIYYKFAS